MIDLNIGRVAADWRAGSNDKWRSFRCRLATSIFVFKPRLFFFGKVWHGFVNVVLKLITPILVFLPLILTHRLPFKLPSRNLLRRKRSPPRSYELLINLFTKLQWHRWTLTKEGPPRNREATVAQWLGHRLLVRRVRDSIPRSSACSEINFSCLYVRRRWFVGIELVSGSITWAHFLLDWVGRAPVNLGSFPSHAFEFNYLITLGKCYVRTVFPSPPSNSSFRGR